MINMSVPVRADNIQLYAAGSLRSALTDAAKAFEVSTGHQVQAKFGPSGLLKKEIADGAKADLFAAADMEYPQALNDLNKSGPVVRFARNRLCALVSPRIKIDSSSLIDRMLDPETKLGTSTPNSDPAGDYAFEVFRKVETIRPGVGVTLEHKALQLVGTGNSALPPPGHSVYGWHIAEGRADIFLAYCTATAEAQKQYPNLLTIELPENIAVSADYGMTVMNGAPPAAELFSKFILSSDGQNILTGYGFAR